MSNRSNRREFFKIMGGAAMAPSMLRAAEAMGITNAFARDAQALGGNLAPNKPIGMAKGIHPGRVVWAHDPAATNWEGPGKGHLWENDHTNPDAVERMMTASIRRLTRAETDRDAWHALFQYFNHSQGHGNVGYRKGEKINIKVNMVGCNNRTGGVDPQSYDLVRNLDYMNASPQMMRALLRQLVHGAGVRQQDIFIGDPLCLFPNQHYEPLHQEFPNVHYLDHYGGNERHPRAAVAYSSIPLYWSARPTGVIQDFLPVSYAEAKYFINMASLKGHASAGVTLCAKNHYGSLIRKPPERGYYDMHTSMLGKALSSPGQYRAVVDLMGHAHTGGKTMVYFLDGLYSGVHVTDHSPRKWSSAPFNGHWTSSFFASQDPVAIDSVGFDFLWAEWDDHTRLTNADDYLHEAALADHPPSGTFYDPDHAVNTTRLASLGVHEHWNNAQDRQYSRNLGKEEGIELIALGPSAA